MKNKLLSKLISFALSFVMLVTMMYPISASANDEVADDSNLYREYREISDSDYYPDDYIGYEYPVRPGTEEWAELSDHRAMVEACTIPEDVLAEMTTEELAQTILAYPLIADMFAYDNWYTGLDIVTDNFNGLEEFSNRTDSSSAIVDLYIEQELVSIDDVDSVTAVLNGEETTDTLNANYNTIKNVLYYMVMSTLLSDDTYSQKMTVNDKSDLLTVAMQKEKQLKNSDIYMLKTAGTLIEGSNISTTASYSYLYQVGYTAGATGSTSLSGPNGSTVEGFTTVCYELWMCSDGVQRIYPNVVYADIPTSYKTTLNNMYYDIYGISPVGQPTVKYNCHSYAWYRQSTSNTYWINNISPYLNAASVVSQMNTSVGDRVVYYSSSDKTYSSPSHSAIITSYTNISSSQRSFTLKSKWGMSGLYSHSLTNCPYYYGETSNSSFIYDYYFYSK